MIKILKNTTSNPISIDVGDTVPANGQITINPQDYDEYAASDDIITFVGNGSIVVNDGSRDLQISDGTRLMLGGYTGKLQLDDDLTTNDRIKVDVTGDATIVGPEGPQGDPGLSGYGVYATCVTDANGTLQRSQGLTPTRTATGTYTYLFTQPLPDNNYAVSAQTYELANASDTNVFIENRTTTSFDVIIGFGDNGTAVDVPIDADHSVIVFGYEGPNGITSSYESWLSIGNTGTEQDFINSLKGDQGIQGIQGIQGVAGNDGTNGINGADGADGADGSEWFVGTGIPNSLIGVDGDFYLDNQDGSVYNKISGQWFFQANIKGPQGDQGVQGVQGIQGPVSIFGSEYNYGESLTESSTTSSSPVNKLSFTTNNLPTGTYRIGYNYNFSMGTTNSDFRAEIELNNNQEVYISEEVKDSGVDQQLPRSGFITLTLSGTQTIDFNYWEESGTTAFVRDVRIELWRVL